MNTITLKKKQLRRLICVTGLFLSLFLSTFCVAGEIKGTIAAIDTETGIIDISGVQIITTNAAIKNLIGMCIELSALETGDRVEVDGAFSEQGEMLATEIEKETFLSDQIEGQLEKVDSTTRTLLISGITVTVAKDAKLRSRDNKVLLLKNLTTGHQVECKGSWTGSKTFSTDRIDLE